jgi:hypothetical protein
MTPGRPILEDRYPQLRDKPTLRGQYVMPRRTLSFVIVRSDLPKISSNDPMNPSAEEAAAIVLGSIARFGTCSIDEATKTINMQLDGTTPRLGRVDGFRLRKLWNIGRITPA